MGALIFDFTLKFFYSKFLVLLKKHKWAQHPSVADLWNNFFDSKFYFLPITCNVD